MKKAQNAGAITALIIIIALFMVLYVLLLPPEEREKLLNQTIDNQSDDVTIDKETSTLLLISPGGFSPL